MGTTSTSHVIITRDSIATKSGRLSSQRPLWTGSQTFGFGRRAVTAGHNPSSV